MKLDTNDIVICKSSSTYWRVGEVVDITGEEVFVHQWGECHLSRYDVDKIGEDLVKIGPRSIVLFKMLDQMGWRLFDASQLLAIKKAAKKLKKL